MKTIDYEIDIKVTNLLLGNGDEIEGIEEDISEEEAEEILRLMEIGDEDECIHDWC